MSTAQEPEATVAADPRVGGARAVFWAGASIVVVYNFLAGANEVFVSNRLQSLDPALLLLLSTGIAAVFFNVLQVRGPRRYAALVRRDLRWVALLNGSTALVWVSFFVALRYAEPAIVATANVALAPALAIVLARWIRPGSSVLGIERFAAAGIVVLLVGGLYVSAIGQSGVGSAFHQLSALGVAASLVCGVSISATAMFAKRLYDGGWKASQVMASRFWVLLAVTGLAVALEGPAQRGLGSIPALGVTAVIAAVVGTVLSLYLLQLGIERLEPVTLGLLLASGPVFTLLLQAFDPRLHFTVASIAIVGLSTVLVAWTLVARDRAERKEETQT